MSPFCRRRATRALSLLVLSAAPRAQSLATKTEASGLTTPVYLTAPQGDPRLFVVEQTTARVVIVESGAVLPTPFLDLSSVVTHPIGERGLLGLAFHPDYAVNGRFYVYYVTGVLPIRSVVERYRVSSDPYRADPASAELVLSLEQPFQEHKGGTLAFGPDGYLYLGLGDGGGNDDPYCNAQRGDTWLGKMLRIDVDHGAPYAIPPGNPWANPNDGVLDEIWAFGLRNPYRFAIDRLTGDAYIADVGQDLFEEVSLVPGGHGGLNFGWKVREGAQCSDATGCPPTVAGCANPHYAAPIHAYPHDATGVCAVVGGALYRGCGIPWMQGRFFFGDFCAGKVWSLGHAGLAPPGLVDHTAELAPGGGGTLGAISAIATDGRGEMHVIDYNGTIRRIVPAFAIGADCDQDGLYDPCEVATRPVLDLDFDGQIDECQGLSADVALLSVASLGQQHLSLHAGPSYAGDMFVLLGSTSGTEPGTVIASYVLPLNVDAYFAYTLGQPDQPPLSGSTGFLDAQGRAQAILSIPPGITPGYAPSSVDHAYVLFDLTRFAPVATSNSVRAFLAP